MSASEQEEEDFASASEGESIEPLQNPPKEPTSESGWTGWSSFLTTAVNAVQESIKEDFNNLYTSAKGITENVLQINSPTEPTESTNEQNTQLENSSSIPSTVKTDGILKSTETVLAAIDKTLDFTSDFIGNAVFGAYGQLEKANHELDLLAHGKQIGNTFVSNGLTALEAIGSVVGVKAATALANARGIKRQAEKAAPSSSNNNNSVVASGGNVKEVTLEVLFEDNCGNAHLQAMEMLASESNAQIEEFAPEILEQCSSELKEIESYLLKDASITATLIDSSVMLTDEGIEKISDTLSSISVASQVQLKQMQSFLIESFTELETLKESKEGKNVLVRKLRQACMRRMADFCEKSCEQTLRVAEVILMFIAEEGLRKKSSGTSSGLSMKNNGVKFASACQKLSSALIAELRFLHGKFYEVASKFGDELTTEDGQNDESLKGLELDKMKKDLEDSIGFVRGASEFMFPIIKLMVLKSTEG